MLMINDFLFTNATKKEFFNNKYNTILNHSYVVSLNNQKSKKRLKNFIHHTKHFIKKPNILNALHFEKDKKKIKTFYPYIHKRSHLFDLKPGEYGRTASFIKFLKLVQKKKYSVWFEDDTQINSNKKLFDNQLKVALKNLPKKGNDIYLLSYLNTKNDCKNKNKWKLRKVKHLGTGQIIFSKDAAQTILYYIKKNGIHTPINNYLHKLYKDRIINIWEWNGNTFPENPMYCGLFEKYQTNHKSKKNSTMFDFKNLTRKQYKYKIDNMII